MADDDPTPTAPLGRGNLAAGLLWASDWCNEALLAGLEARGWPRFTRTQSLVFARLGEGVERAADLARDIGVTRQSMQAVLAPLLEEGLLVTSPDPDDGRAQRLTLGARGEDLAADAAVLLDRLWGVLDERIGPAATTDLRQALAADWGQPPEL